MLTLDLSKLNGFLPQDYLSSREGALREAARMLAEHNGPGGDFTGWVTLPRDYDKEEPLPRAHRYSRFCSGYL